MGAYNVTFGQSSVNNVDYEAYLKGGGELWCKKQNTKIKQNNKTKRASLPNRVATWKVDKPLELRDRIGDPIMIGRYLDFFPIISDARFLSVRSEIGRFFVCVHYSWQIQVNFSK